MTNREGVDDKELEFERIALVHLDTIYNAALRLTGHTSDAEDLVQETFLKAYRFFHRYREDSNCLAWLFRIMKNSYINRFRQKSREPAMVSNDGLDGLVFKPKDTSGEPDKEMLDRLLDDEVEQAVQALPDEFKMVVLLSDIQGLQYKEIADILSCPIGTVRSRLSLGRRLLKRQLWAYAQDHGFVDKDAVCMNCKKAEEIITTSIDGELEPGLEEQLTDHLESCPRCEQEYEQEQHFKWMVRDRLNRVPAPVHLKSQIKAAIRTIHAPVSWRQHAGDFVDRYPRQIAGAMAAMLLVTFSLFTGQYNQPHNPPALVVELVKHHANCAIEITSNQPEEIKGWFKQRGVNLTVDTPPLDAFDGELLGAHLCQMLHKDAAYLVYENNEKEVSICCIEHVDIELDALDRIEFGNAQYYTITYGDRNLVLWQDGETIYSIIGETTQDDLLAMAAETRGI